MLRTVTVMASGLLLALVAGVASLSDPLVGVEQLLLALLFFAAHYFGARSNNKALHSLAVLAGLGLIVMQALTSHAASESGWLAITSSSLHWLVAIGWAGCVLHLAMQPWPALVEADGHHNEHITAITEHYASMSLAALAVLALTGGLLGFVHVHNIDALNTSAYGASYKVKALLALLLLISVSMHKLRIVPACRQATSAELLHRAVQRFRRLVSIEAIVLAALVITTSHLAIRTPPGVAPFLRPQSWELAVGDVPMRVDLQPVAGQVSRVRLEFTALTPDFQFADATRLTFSMAMSDRSAGHRGAEALPIGPAAFLGETVLAMPGEWQLDLLLEYPNGEIVSTSHVITLPEPPLQQDMRAYLSSSTIAYSTATTITFGVGILLILVAVWSIRMSIQKRAPAWMMPAGLINIAVGGFLMLSVMFVKTYPSSFWTNPQPFTFEVVQEGDAIYRTHCADCHGISGAGDGPWAVATRGSLPDLKSPHMDTHTDGELFWWHKYGIPSLAMPAFSDELTDDENWMVINFLRSLRHDIPPPH